MSSNSHNSQVVAETNNKIGTFLYELIHRVTNYRSLHNLTEQIEHQYHGRVLIELIQNAHDALFPQPATDAGRIEITLNLQEGSFGTLYAANDGACFSPSNFESMSRLGQSDKTPEQSIGNKGIGFRSVLEIADAPEIYSRSAVGSTTFDGYCFAFDPAHLDRLAERIATVLKGGTADFLADWNEGMLAKLRSAVSVSFLRDEMRFLSPYLLPVPLTIETGSAVEEFARRGFTSVIRLPLKSTIATELCRHKIAEFDPVTLLFLDRVKCLTIDDGVTQREFVREAFPRNGSSLGGTEVLLEEKNAPRPMELYWMWKHELACSDFSTNVARALELMPGKWRELQTATVSVAVRVGAEPLLGRLSIFLPTLQTSGCGAHINAPFFGDMSRTSIDFNNAYNAFLLNEAANLTLRVVATDLAGRGQNEATAIVDLLARPAADDVASARWFRAWSSAIDGDIETRLWFLSDQGWRGLGAIFALRPSENATVITREALRTHAGFAVFTAASDSRAGMIQALADACGLEVLADYAQFADAVERLAHDLLGRPQTDWNGFWVDAEALFDGKGAALAGKKILLGTDDQLHASDEKCTVFFSARSGTGPGGEGTNDPVPATLRAHVAFLNEQIRSARESTARIPGPVRIFLESSRLVRRFDVEEIFNAVLVKYTPRLPVAPGGADEAICQGILLWGLRLLAQLTEQGRGSRLLESLGRLPAPCRGGWYRVEEASFGPGWSNTHGETLLSYLRGLPGTHGKEAQARLLLSPDDPCWGNQGMHHQKLLQEARVCNGLRLLRIKPDDWQSDFEGNQDDFPLPPLPPPGISTTTWDQYRQHVRTRVRPTYQMWTSYRVQQLYTFPGFVCDETLNSETRLAATNLLLGSMGTWGEGWREICFSKVGGQPDQISAESPLAFVLRTRPWLGIEENGAAGWSRPRERWYVQAAALEGNRAWQYSHLKPLPVKMAARLDDDPALSKVLQTLGMPRYEPDTRSASTRLLDDLALAVQNDSVPDRNVFLGQVRAAWSALVPDGTGTLPSLLIVRRRGGRLSAWQPSAASPIYLPDSSKTFVDALDQFDLPVLALEKADAKRLSEIFVRRYATAICPTSTLKLVPTVEGSPWTGPAEERLAESELKSLLPIFLTIYAFFGTQPRGTASKRFKDQAVALRAARLAWIPDLKILLVHGETHLSAPATKAFWLEEERVLLVDESCRQNLWQLAEATAQMFGQEDLELPIQSVLRELITVEPTVAAIEIALHNVRISDEHLAEVRGFWRGDLGRTVRMLQPLLALLRPEVELGALVDFRTDAEVEGFIDGLNDPRLKGAALLNLCREAADLSSFGRQAWQRFAEDERLQLGAWNAFLAQRHERPLLNDDAATEFQQHGTAAFPLLRSLLAAMVRRRPTPQSYRHLQAELDRKPCPDSYAQEFWEVSFQRSLEPFLDHFEQWGATEVELDALRGAATRENLETRLQQAGVDTGFDPGEAARNNLEKLRLALDRLRQIGLAWAMITPGADPAFWESCAESFLAALDAVFDLSGHTAFWSDADVMSLLHTLPQTNSTDAFWQAFSTCSDPESLAAALGLTPEHLEKARTRLQNFQENIYQINRRVRIAGQEFDGAEENFRNLYTHLCRALPDARLELFPALDLRRTSGDLTVMASRIGRNDRRGAAGGGRTPVRIKRMTKAREALLGLVGEIHAFRLLKLRYQARNDSWISVNGQIVFPGNGGDDGLGCDFRVSHGRRLYYIEVKASEGSDELFNLGSSELRLATDIALRPRAYRGTEYLILHVTHALSEEPGFRLLPNPCHPRYQNLFDLDGAGMRVRYRTSAPLP